MKWDRGPTRGGRAGAGRVRAGADRALAIASRCLRVAGHPRGFALIEMMTVVLIAGSLARIAAPNVEVMLHRARAADVLGDIRVLELAVFEYNSATGTWPATGEPGVAPEELDEFLPEDFGFRSAHHTLTWRRWDLRDGLPDHPEVDLLAGVAVTIPDDEIGAALLEMVGSGRVHLTVGDHHTFILARES